MRRAIAWLSLLLISFSAHAEVTVLIHGYLSSAQAWHQSGILSALRQRGYEHAGNLSFSSKGVRLEDKQIKTLRPVYTVDLPSQSSIPFQTDWLEAYLRTLRKLHPDETFTLIGHSAGGLVARLTVVRNRSAGIRHLMTIASPHLGTQRATEALNATRGGMFGPVRSFFTKRRTGTPLYRTLRGSRPALYDLAPPKPGNLLFWLNRQPHPKMRYTSIIRTGTPKMPGDHVVPPPSQDLRRVPALGERAQSYTSPWGHQLTRQDGFVIANLLDRARKKT